MIPLVRKNDFAELQAAGHYLFTADESTIIVCLPDRPLVPVSIPVSREKQPRAWLLTGTLDCPTLSPSIQVSPPGNWHGYITNGQLNGC